MNSLPIMEFAFMVGVDILFIGALMLLMLPLGIWRQAAFAVMKRNFTGYFSNPTGYVFLCLFVLLTSFAAFWPHEFFTTNLANFDQLNRFLPYIMLIFIPAITMSIWSEERRQGTDELLLTLPARDFDIVIGKYFAAVLVFTVSLLFSQLSNYAVLIAMTGGDLDSGLLFATYLGYWFVGIAMLSIGMVASFLTNNLTVGFVFGVVFNAPLAFFSNADVIISNTQTVNRMYEWSLLQRFDPFGRGLISLSSVFYFLGIAILGIYLSLVLIGRRHWQGGKHGTSLLGHYFFRTVFLVITIIAVVLIAQYSPLSRLRLDVSRNKISTLTPNTLAILKGLDEQKDPFNPDKPAPPIVIDAYVGSNVPTEFMQTRYDLVNLLRELKVMSDRIQVNLHTDVEPFSEEAILAEQRFGIRPRLIVSESRGAMRREEVILGAAFSSGLQREVIDFFSNGSPVEYELVRSINTVAQPEREKIGVVETDVLAANETFTLPNGQVVDIPPLAVIDEMRKQYAIENVQLGQPLNVWLSDDEETAEVSEPSDQPGGQLQYDALLVIQPSKLSPVEMDNLIKAIEDGQPTIIFEDAAPSQPSLVDRVFETLTPRRLPRGGSLETAKIQDLWDALGITLSGRLVRESDAYIPDLIWQRYNPYKRDRSLDEPERLVIDNANPAAIDEQISEAYPATAGIKELLFNFTSAFTRRPDSRYKMEPLVMARSAGRIAMDVYAQTRNAPEARNVYRGSEVQGEDLVLAARISTSEYSEDLEAGDVNCILVSDVDILADEMVALRDQPTRGGIEYRYQNIDFVLNLIDSMTAQSRYIQIRDRRPTYVTLRHVEETIREATDEVDTELQNYEKDFEVRMSQARGEAITQLDELRRDVSRLEEERNAGNVIDEAALEARRNLLEQVERGEAQKLQQLMEEMQNERNEKIRSIRLKSELQIQEIQRRYKLAAVLIPPIPPLLLGLIVFTRRRLREREGISKARRIR